MRYYVLTVQGRFPFIYLNRVYPFLHMSEVPDTAEATYATEVQARDV